MDEANTLLSNGHSPPEGAAPLPPPRQNVSLRPAMMVGIIAVGLLIVFSIAAIVSNPGSGKIAKGNTTPQVVPGTTLRAIPGARALRPIETPGEPPDNVLNAIRIPDGAVVQSTTNNASAGDQYDRQIQFAVAASENDVFTFYRSELGRLGWKTFSNGAATNLPGGIEVLAQQAGTDGWYWDIGAVISPTTFPTSSSRPFGLEGAQQITRFTIRLFQVPDQN